MAKALDDGFVRQLNAQVFVCRAGQAAQSPRLDASAETTVHADNVALRRWQAVVLVTVLALGKQLTPGSSLQRGAKAAADGLVQRSAFGEVLLGAQFSEP